MSVSTPSYFRPEVPASIWSRSGRPRWATIIRLYIAFSLIWIGFFFDGGIARWGWVAAGVGVFLLFPVLVRLLLRPVEREVRGATRRTASHRLGLLRGRRLVRTFAPHGWKTAQEATLHLIAGDGQAAAQAYAETGRLARLREPSGLLLSAQVHAWILAKDLPKARELSAAREKLGDLSPWDRLHSAALELAAGKCGTGVIRELQELREALGDHPWILAGLTLAHERAGELTEALALAEEAKAAGAEEDELAATMLKRADKGMRAFKKNQRKKAKAKQKKPSGDDAKRGEKKRSEDPRSPRGSKKARKQARREARRRAKAEERQRRSEEAARRQRELKTRARRAKQPEPAEAPASEMTAAAQVAEVSVPLESAPAVSAPVIAAPAPVIAAPAPAAVPAAVPAAPARAPQAAPQAASGAPSVAASAPVIASPVAPRGGGVVLPPLVRPGERAAAPSRAKPPPPPTRARGPRSSVPTPRPPRLNLPRLVGNRSAAGLPTRSAKPAAPGAPRVLAPPPAATPVKEESGEWGDLDTLFQD